MVSCFCSFVPFGLVMSLCGVVCAFADGVACGEVCASPAGTSEVLLAFDFITHEVPDILVQGLVLGLHAEADLIHCDVVWIHQAVASGCAYLGEQVTPCSF